MTTLITAAKETTRTLNIYGLCASFVALSSVRLIIIMIIIIIIYYIYIALYIILYSASQSWKSK